MTETTPQATDVERPHGTWGDAVAPLVRKLEVAAALKQEAVWTAEGTAPFAKLLKEMARTLDEDALEAIRVRDELIEQIVEKNSNLMAIGKNAVDAIKTLEANNKRLIEVFGTLIEESGDAGLKSEFTRLVAPSPAEANKQD